MRQEHKKNPPLRFGNVHDSAAPAGAKCSRCKKPAQKLLRNAFRSSTVCEDRDCRTREECWVGNLPHTPIVADGSWASQKKRADDDRSFRVKRTA